MLKRAVVCVAGVLGLLLVKALSLANEPKRSSLKRIGKNAYKLNKRVQAWNVDGSSTADLDRSSHTSWINLWEETTGRKRGMCSYSNCEEHAQVGGHVWLKDNGVFITPLCKGCNHYANPNRMQSREGRKHPFLRAGTVVVRARYTADMKAAERRFSIDEAGFTRLCISCNCDISRQPKSHTQCLSCFKSSRSFYGKEGNRRSFVRRCSTWNADISDRPRSHQQCYNCYCSRGN